MRYEKLTPTLAMAAHDFERGGVRALEVHRANLGLVSVDDTPKPARVVVFLHTEPGADLSHLGELGVELNEPGPAGGMHTGIVPLERLGDVTEDPAVTRVIPAHRLRPLLDVAVPAVKVPALRASTGLTGKGVVVGIIDTGIEAGHPSFAGRILRIWDQTLGGPGVPEGGYGVELSGPTLTLSRDTHGHGTHVAGIAAGADETFGGVAPEANLLIVKTDLMDAHIADGIRYVFRVAKELKRPAVVNLSLGGQADAHDGTDALAAVVDEQVGPGRIVCCAAGNAGNDNIHAQVLMREGRTRTIAFATLRRLPNEPAFVAVFSGWYSGDDEVGVAVVSPSDQQTPFQPVLTQGSPVRDYDFPGEGLVRVITPGPDPANGDHNFVVMIQPDPNPTPAPGTPPRPRRPWRLRLEGTKVTRGTVDVWSVDDSVAQFTGPAAVDSMKVGTPGAATHAVTLASFTTRVEWKDIFGEPHAAGLELDDISDFSSEGPRRDGARKPDLATPGAMIVSSLSVHSGVPPGALVDDRHTVMAGTSMACPFASGVVALLLQRQPKLTPKKAKSLLRSNSAIPGKRAGAWDPKWGYGLLDAEHL
ncbi:MAG: S8 family serine peptidase [Acidimicrobiales bacterium]